MIKNIFILLILNIIFLPVKAQEINGRIVDVAKHPLEFVNVSLLSKQDSSIIGGSVTNESGVFIIKYDTNLNDVLIKMSRVGYKSLFLAAKHDMGDVVLAESDTLLNEVVVNAIRPTFKMRNGKLNVNVQHTMLANNGNALEVLSAVPFVNRSGDGVSVIGRGTPIIYIDNRKVSDMADLKKLQSNEIKSIQTDLHPGAAYGSEVRAVIKITLINHEEGLSGTFVGQAYQTKCTNGMGYGHLNFRNGKWDVFCGLSSQYNRKAPNSDNELTFESNHTQTTVLQQFDNKYKSFSLNPDFGFDYSDNGKNEFGIKYSFTRFPHINSLLYGTSTTLLNSTTEETAGTNLNSKSGKYVHSANGYYIKSWKGNTLNLSVDYLNGESKEWYSSAWSEMQDITSNSHSYYDLLIAKASLSHKLWGGTLNYGTEWSKTNHKQQYKSQESELTDMVESNDRNEQLLAALFVSQSKEFGKFSSEMGLRMEYADYRFYQDGVKDAETSKKYFRLLPSIEIDYDTDNLSFSLSFDNTIRRPSYSQLSSSMVYVDKYTYQRGNPLLRPSYDYVLDFVATWKDFSFDISHTWYEDRILQTYGKTTNQSAVVFETNNIPHYREWGATLDYSPNLRFWRPKAEISVFKQKMSYHGETYNKPYFTYELDNVFRINNHINLSFDLWGTARGHQYLSDMKPTFRADFAVNSSFCKNRLGLWLKVTDLFNTDKEWYVTNINNIRFGKANHVDTRGIMLQVRYSFNPQRNKYKGMTPFGGEVMRL